MLRILLPNNLTPEENDAMQGLFALMNERRTYAWQTPGDTDNPKYQVLLTATLNGNTKTISCWGVFDNKSIAEAQLASLTKYADYLNREYATETVHAAKMRIVWFTETPPQVHQ